MGIIKGSQTSSGVEYSRSPVPIVAEAHNPKTPYANLCPARGSKIVLQFLHLGFSCYRKLSSLTIPRSGTKQTYAQRGGTLAYGLQAPKLENYAGTTLAKRVVFQNLSTHRIFGAKLETALGAGGFWRSVARTPKIQKTLSKFGGHNLPG